MATPTAAPFALLVAVLATAMAAHGVFPSCDVMALQLLYDGVCDWWIERGDGSAVALSELFTAGLLAACWNVDRLLLYVGKQSVTASASVALVRHCCRS